MLVTALTRISKTKTRVEIDYDKTLVLSDKDMAAYDIRENEEIPDAVWEELLAKLCREALIKSGTLLSDTDLSEEMLRRKLLRAGYPEEAAFQAAEKMKEAGYVNDRRTAENYIRYHLQDRSRLRIRMDLRERGIGQDVIDAAFAALEEETDDTPEENELEQIRRLLKKRGVDPHSADSKTLLKTMAFLVRKGYPAELVRKALS